MAVWKSLFAVQGKKIRSQGQELEEVEQRAAELTIAESRQGTKIRNLERN